MKQNTILGLLFSALIPLPVAADYVWTINALPATGETEKYLAIKGEDSDYINHPLSYTDNNNGTVTDNVTGLMWQQNESEDVIPWSGSSQYCGSLTEGNYSDWRVPNSIELMSIIKNGTGRGNPPFDSVFISDPETEYWWSSTESLFSERRKVAWLINSGGGIGNHSQDDDRVKVRCVRDEDNIVQTVEQRFFEKEGRVYDIFTGLEWEQQGELNKTFVWEEAIKHCENLTFAGFTDWRLPNHKELKTINEEKHVGSPTIHKAFALAEKDSTGKYLYWSSTSLSERQAWYVEFASGLSSHTGIDREGKDSSLYARCVRTADMGVVSNNH